MTSGAATSPISIIVPVFNARRTLKGCLAALARLEGDSAEREILLIDNGSTDGSLEQCQAFAAGRPGVRVETCAQAGPAAARNRGAELAAGDLLLFTDSDCYPHPQWLLRLVRRFRLAETAAEGRWAAAGGRIVAWGRGRAPIFAYYERRRILNQRKFFAEPQPGFRPFFATANFAVRRSVYRRLGGFDPALLMCEDADFCWRLQEAGGVLAYADDAVVLHHFSSRTGALWSTTVKYGAAVRQLQKKHPGHFPLGASLELERWVWLAKAVAKTPVAAVIHARDPYRRHEPWFDVISNAGYLWGRWASPPRRR